MILRSVELESFGRFRNQTIEFRRGMNLVIGPNEAGKSTLAEAVPAVLFGTDRLERFKPWGRNSCVAALFFEGHGRTIQVKRNLVTDDVELVEKDDLYHVLSQFSGRVPLRGKSASCREYRELLESLLGVSDEKLFRATYFFGHYPQEWSGDDLAQKLRTLVSGTAETDYAAILDGLLDEHFALTRSNPWGRDKQRDREYEEVCRQLSQQGESETVPVFVEIDDSLEISQQIDQLEKELARDRQDREKGLRYIERVRREKEAAPAPANPGVAEKPAFEPKAANQQGALAKQLANAGLPTAPPRDLPALLSEAAEIRQELAALQQPFALINSREQKVPKVPWPMLVGSVVILIALVAGVWWQDFHLLWIAPVAAILSAGFLGWGAWQHVKRKRALDECRSERSRLEQKKLAAQTRQAELSERCEALGLPSSAIDLVRLQKLVTTHRGLLESYWNQDAPNMPGQTITKADHGEKVATPAIPGPADLSPEAVAELRQLEERMAEFERELLQKESRLQELRQKQAEQADGERPKSAQVRPDLGKRKRQLEEQIAVLRTAINLLAGAVDEFGRSHLSRLNDSAGKLLGKITGGRYPVLTLDENMTPALQVDGRRWVTFEQFSRGTIDAIYLALRIALGGIRSDGRSLPLMLDDPFVHLDQKRLTTTMNLIDLTSADGQLILFSHNLELGKRAARERWHVVPLDGESANVNVEEGGEHAGQLHLL